VEKRSVSRQTQYEIKGLFMSSIAAQLYTVREHTKTAADLASTFRKLRQIGYSAVQISAIGPIDPKEVASMLNGEGLTCCVTHVGLDRMRNEPAAIIEQHRLWNCSYTAIGGFFPKDPTADDWLNFASDFNSVVKPLQAAGIAVGYHNHSHELVKYGNTTALTMLLSKLDPSIWFEIDTYWITHGGGDPAAWIDKVAGRIPCVHLKDMGIDKQSKQYMMEVGEGNLNWPGILAACKRAGVKWYIAEQDICYRDPFESLKISLENLRALGIH